MMDTSEKLCLQWNDFKDNTFSSFKELREDRDFADVTLVCETGQQIEAHKVVLASASPFFTELLKKNRHPHPLIYMRGLKAEDLTAIVDFFYHGEANVVEENLDSFLALAEELRLKGLTGASEAQIEPEKEEPRRWKPPLKREMSQKVQAPESSSNFHGTSSNGSFDTAVAITKDKIIVDSENLDEQIKSMITKTDVKTSDGQGNLAVCNVCGKQGPLKAMPRHIEANHITGVSHTCQICGKISRSRDGLRNHISRSH